MQNHDYKNGDKVYFIRRCSEYTALMSQVETGVYVEDMPGWIYDAHLRIQPDIPDSKTISVPSSRTWRRDEAGKEKAGEYVKKIMSRQKQSLKRLQEKLEASEWKLKQIEQILHNIPD